MTPELSDLRQSIIAQLPKAELHLHIEGSLEPEMMFMLAQRNMVEIPYTSVEEIRKAYAFSNLQDFLDIYYQGMAVLCTEQDFFDLTYAYLERAQSDCVRHVEIFFDPQGHTSRGVPFDSAIGGILRALEEGEKQFKISHRLIMCFLRHLDEASAFETLSQAEPWIDSIAGVGLDSSELGHPPSKFARVFALARQKGLKLVAHAGEEGPPEYVWEALDHLHVDRIDHGNRALEDEALIQRIVAEEKTLTVCPLSNLKLCVVSNLVDSPVKQMLDAGMRVTINSDDPSYFGGYINANFAAVADAQNLSIDNLKTLARNSFTGSFLSDEHIAQYIAAVDLVMDEFC